MNENAASRDCPCSCAELWALNTNHSSPIPEIGGDATHLAVSNAVQRTVVSHLQTVSNLLFQKSK